MLHYETSALEPASACIVQQCEVGYRSLCNANGFRRLNFCLRHLLESYTVCRGAITFIRGFLPNVIRRLPNPLVPLYKYTSAWEYDCYVCRSHDVSYSVSCAALCRYPITTQEDRFRPSRYCHLCPVIDRARLLKVKLSRLAFYSTPWAAPFVLPCSNIER